MDALRIWLWTGAGSPPDEYLDFLLIKHVYHCTPSELDAQPSGVVELHKAFMLAEWDNQHRKQQKRKKR